MNPRAVQMAKAVAEYDAGSIDTELLGNILAPQYRGWTNNSANYYTRSPDLAALWFHGSPFMGQPGVYGYQEDGTPLYRWFPVRPSNIQGLAGPDYAQVRGITPSPFSGLPEPPPIDNLDTYIIV
jgi:hypothetical protein